MHIRTALSTVQTVPNQVPLCLYCAPVSSTWHCQMSPLVCDCATRGRCLDGVSALALTEVLFGAEQLLQSKHALAIRGV